MHERERNGQGPKRLRWTGTALVAAFVWALLAWEYTHGGIVTHRLLARDDLPGLSNAWGGLLLPALAWYLLGRMQRRPDASPRTGGAPSGRGAMLAGFVGAAGYGAVMAYCYVAGPAEVTSVMARAVLLIALVVPIYRSEYVLGFVLAMAYTFGGILPVLFAAVVALLAFAIHRGVRRAFAGVAGWRGRRSTRRASA